MLCPRVRVCIAPALAPAELYVLSIPLCFVILEKRNTSVQDGQPTTVRRGLPATVRMFQPSLCVSCAAHRPRRGGSLGFLNRLTRSLTADAVSRDCILAPCSLGRNLGNLSMNSFGLHYLPIHSHSSSGTTRRSALPSLAVAYLQWEHSHGVFAPQGFAQPRNHACYRSSDTR